MGSRSRVATMATRRSRLTRTRRRGERADAPSSALTSDRQQPLCSDHYVSNDAAFIAHVDGTLQAVIARPDLVVLLGITPDSADGEYGWIEPGDPVMGSSPWDLCRVRQFWEKPFPRVAQALRARGCLWNSFVMVAAPAPPSETASPRIGAPDT